MVQIVAIHMTTMHEQMVQMYDIMIMCDTRSLSDRFANLLL